MDQINEVMEQTSVVVRYFTNVNKIQLICNIDICSELKIINTVGLVRINLCIESQKYSNQTVRFLR